MEMGRKQTAVVKVFITVFFILWTIISLGKVIRNTLEPLGANDLYTYWYAGLFLRTGIDPYQAFHENLTPEIPIHFLGHTTTDTNEIVIPELVPAPGYTFPFLLFFTPFAYLSWHSAKWVWLLLNLLLVVSLPPLIYIYLPKKSRPSMWISFMSCLFLLGMTATRYALSSGQATFLVLTLLLMSLLLSREHPLWAGLFLGVALSKYSLSAGFLLFFLLVNRNYRLVIAALLTQAGGLLLFLVMADTSLVQAVQGYSMMFTHHAPMDGIHLSSLITSTNIWVDIFAAALISLITVFPLWRLRDSINLPMKQLVAACGFLGWSLLVAYHRLYDSAGLIFFYCTIFVILSVSASWQLKPNQEKVLIVFTFLTIPLLMVPAGEYVRDLIPVEIGKYWIFLIGRSTTIIILGTIAVSIGLLIQSLSQDHLQVQEANDV